MSEHGSEAFFETLLDSVDQAIWVVDGVGSFHFVNRAAVTALGYGAATDLEGRPSHETIQYKHPDGLAFPVSQSRLRRAQLAGASVRVEADWFVCRDGSMLPVSYVSGRMKVDGGVGAACAFQEAPAERDPDRATQRRIIEAGDAARRRLARDLHDGAQQHLVVALMNLQLARQKLPRDSMAAEALLTTGLEMAESGLSELRELVAGIHPAILTHLGLAAAVEALAARLPLPVRLELAEERFPASVEASVYFLVSEGLTNVVKHAEAGEAGVVTARAGDELIVEVRDDGAGGAESGGGGSGLSGLADRVAALEGELTVTSVPGAGTTLRAVIPV